MSTESSVDAAAQLLDNVNEHVKSLAARRKKAVLGGTRRWAQRAPLAIAHRVTKPTEFCGTHSASADKKHLGEGTPQDAADRGADEWGPGWGDTGADVASDVLKAVEAMEVVERDFEDMVLPELDDDIIYRGAMLFKASTEMGTDWLRPRHVALLSRVARASLGIIFGLIEKVMRWPNRVRYIISVALAKKDGRIQINRCRHHRLQALGESSLHPVSRCPRVEDCAALPGSRPEPWRGTCRI